MKKESVAEALERSANDVKIRIRIYGEMLKMHDECIRVIKEQVAFLEGLLAEKGGEE